MVKNEQSKRRARSRKTLDASPLPVRLTIEERETVENLADEEGRSLSQMVRLLINEGLKARSERSDRKDVPSERNN